MKIIDRWIATILVAACTASRSRSTPTRLVSLFPGAVIHVDAPQHLVFSLVPATVPPFLTASLLLNFSTIRRLRPDYRIRTTCPRNGAAANTTRSQAPIPPVSFSFSFSFFLIALFPLGWPRAHSHLLFPIGVRIEWRGMPIKTLFRFRRYVFGFCSLVVFSPTALVGQLGARSTGHIIEYCGLEAAPKPGHYT